MNLKSWFKQKVQREINKRVELCQEKDEIVSGDDTVHEVFDSIFKNTD